MKLVKWIVLFFTMFVFLFQLAIPTSAATIDKKALEKLVKTTETQAVALKKHMDIYEPEEIKLIDTKTLTNLTTAITKARTGLKNYKGAKVSFEKRIKNSELTLKDGKIFNNAITKGTKLQKDLSTFRAQFKEKPFASEKALKELTKKNDTYTNYKKSLNNASAIEAFSLRYQTAIENEIRQTGFFYNTNKRIEGFIHFTKENDDSDVFTEILSIDLALNQSIMTKAKKDLLKEKWNKVYWPNFVEPERAAIENLFLNYGAAVQAKDAQLVSSLFYFEAEEERIQYIASLEEYFASVEDFQLDNHFRAEIKFVYADTAIIIINPDQVKAGHKPQALLLTKVNGNWLINAIE